MRAPLLSCCRSVRFLRLSCCRLANVRPSRRLAALRICVSSTDCCPAQKERFAFFSQKNKIFLRQVFTDGKKCVILSNKRGAAEKGRRGRGKGRAAFFSESKSPQNKIAFRHAGVRALSAAERGVSAREILRQAISCGWSRKIFFPHCHSRSQGSRRRERVLPCRYNIV